MVVRLQRLVTGELWRSSEHIISTFSVHYFSYGSKDIPDVSFSIFSCVVLCLPPNMVSSSIPLARVAFPKRVSICLTIMPPEDIMRTDLYKLRQRKLQRIPAEEAFIMQDCFYFDAKILNFKAFFNASFTLQVKPS